MPRSTWPRLLGDIGGTNARFALQQADGSLTCEEVLATRDFPSLREAVEAYLGRVGVQQGELRPRHAAFGIANPITGDQVRMTNCAWAFSISEFKQQLELDTFLLLNDFTVLALALPQLTDAEKVQVGGGTPVANGPIALLGPGTGLGVSGLLSNGHGGWLPIAGEGGHVTVSVQTRREWDIVEWVQQRHPHVSTERLVSGGNTEPMGIRLMYEAICALDGVTFEPLTAADITTRGIEGSDRVCREVVDTFCALLGTAAGNLSILLGARGGCYIGGGIVPKLGDYFARSPFRERFEFKGRFSGYLRDVPSYVIHAKYPAFTGAAAALEQALNEAQR